ncbi:MAG: hypothetical protein QXG86_01580 [Candidatus Woesearchaeota archaeon]
MIINNKNIPDRIIELLVSGVKAKKELSGIEDSFVRNEILKILSHSRKKIEYFSSHSDTNKILKSRFYKDVIKKTRAILRKSSGAFIKEANIKNIKKVLYMHESTRERIKIYPEVYKKIFNITGVPKSVLDLGCGFNPLAYNYLNCKPDYYAFDIDSRIIETLNIFFKKRKIKGKAKIINLREIKNNKIQLPKTDICFMFKLLDSIEIEKGHKLSETLIKAVPSKWVIISFSTKTLSGKRMRHPYRGWVEQICKRLGYFYEILEFENEIFYVIKKN